MFPPEPSAPDQTRAELLAAAVRCLTDGGFEDLASRLHEAFNGAASNEPHPAIARIDAQLDRYLTRLEPQRGGDTSRPCGHDERTSIATSFRELTTARRELL